ncbi:MAG: LysM peptidoglycan-binding domain-containing protein [Desulfosarcinaceae bacterium]
MPQDEVDIAEADSPESDQGVNGSPDDQITLTRGLHQTHPLQAPGDADPTADAAEPEAKQEQSSLDEALDFCEVAQSYWQKGELESALEALDKAYSLILDVDTKEDAKLIQQKEDLRYLISKRILEIYASRNIVVNGNYNEIPLEMNRHVEAELKRFNNGEKQFFMSSYQRSGRYRDYIVSALKKAGMPEELSWLPLIESGFKVKALSRARALGLWQFIPSTGYKFGLKRNSFIDERIDFIKATDAAIEYLKQLHSIFGDWATVLAAYNCGEGRVLKVIRTQNINYLDNFWDLYERLPMETARYVPRFFATLHMVKNPEKYGLDKVERDPALAFAEIETQRQVQLKSISSKTGIDLDTLKALNPELRYQILPPEPYKLRVPVDSADTVLASIDTIPTVQLPQRAIVWHRVRFGETLSTIARRYRSSVSKIMRANHLRRSHFIRAGQRLKIPQRGYAIASSSATAKKIPASGTHYVRKGDSLWIIAKRYGTTVKKIMDVNGLSTNYLSIGQALKIPGFKTEPLPDTGDLSTYKVKRGDSPFTIAQEHNMTLERLLQINRLHPLSKIYPGQKLYVE